MNDLLAVTRPFNLEGLVCLVMVRSMAVGVVCIGNYRLVAALSRLSLLAAGGNTSEAASNHTASTTDGPTPGHYFVKCRGGR